MKSNKEGFTWHVFDIVKVDQIVPKKISTKKLKITNRKKINKYLTTRFYIGGILFLVKL